MGAHRNLSQPSSRSHKTNKHHMIDHGLLNQQTMFVGTIPPVHRENIEAHLNRPLLFVPTTQTTTISLCKSTETTAMSSQVPPQKTMFQRKTIKIATFWVIQKLRTTATFMKTSIPASIWKVFLTMMTTASIPM